MVAVIVVALVVAGIFAYKAFSGSSSATLTTPGTTESLNGAILPHGTSLDFDTVKKFNKNDKLFPYPTVTPNDIGQQLNGLMNL